MRFIVVLAGARAVAFWQPILQISLTTPQQHSPPPTRHLQVRLRAPPIQPLGLPELGLLGNRWWSEAAAEGRGVHVLLEFTAIVPLLCCHGAYLFRVVAFCAV